jgi:hypothetical protein
MINIDIEIPVSKTNTIIFEIEIAYVYDLAHACLTLLYFCIEYYTQCFAKLSLSKRMSTFTQKTFRAICPSGLYYKNILTIVNDNCK